MQSDRDTKEASLISIRIYSLAKWRHMGICFTYLMSFLGYIYSFICIKYLIITKIHSINIYQTPYTCQSLFQVPETQECSCLPTRHEHSNKVD